MAYEVVMPYHLHMPSYFLETFTEYPYICELHNISMDFRIGKERFFESGIPYSDFYVSLTFYDIIKDESVDYTFDID